MEREIKVKVTDAKDMTQKEWQKIFDNSMRKAKAFYQSAPYSTKVYLCMKTGLSMTFVKDNWEEIIK